MAEQELAGGVAVVADDPSPPPPPVVSDEASPDAPALNADIGGGDDFPEELIELASEYGIDPSRFKSPDALEAYVEARVDAEREFEERVARNRDADRRPDSHADARSSAPTMPELLLEALGEDIDPSVVKQFGGVKEFMKTFSGHVGQRMERLERMFGQVAEAARNAESLDFERRFDETIDGMNEFAELFGKGRGADLKKSSRGQFRNRDKLYAQVESLQKAYQEQGRRVSFDDLVRRAIYSEFPDHLKKVSREELAAKTKKRSEQLTHAPTGRVPAPENEAEAHLRRVVESVKQKHGL